MLRRFLIALALGAAFVLPVRAGDQLSVRLVVAEVKGEIDPKLSDIAAFLQDSLPFGGLKLVAEQTIDLPADKPAEVTFPEFKVRCQGPQNKLVCEVLRHGDAQDQSLVKSTLDMQDGKPVVLGTFAAGGKKYLFVLLTRVAEEGADSRPVPADPAEEGAEAAPEASREAAAEEGAAAEPPAAAERS